MMEAKCLPRPEQEQPAAVQQIVVCSPMGHASGQTASVLMDSSCVIAMTSGSAAQAMNANTLRDTNAIAWIGSRFPVEEQIQTTCYAAVAIAGYVWGDRALQILHSVLLPDQYAAEQVSAVRFYAMRRYPIKPLNRHLPRNIYK